MKVWRRPARDILLVLMAGTLVLACGPENDTTNGFEYAGPYCDISPWQCDRFETGPQLIEPGRYDHHAVMLDDGRVLLIGGRDSNHTGEGPGLLASCELVDPVANSVEATGSLLRARQRSAVVKLDGGDVLLLGGIYREGTEWSAARSVERYEVATGSWREVAPLGRDYSQIAATLLGDGRVLLFGSVWRPEEGEESMLHGEVYDPTQDTWTATASIASQGVSLDQVAAAALPDGDVLVLASHESFAQNGGGFINGIDWAYESQITALLYDVTGDAWEVIETFDFKSGGLEAQITWLPDAQAYLISDYVDWYGSTRQLHLFDTTTGALENIYAGERSGPGGRVMAVLPGDKVIFQGSRSVDIFDVPTREWSEFTAYPANIRFSTLTLLPGCHLFASGLDPWMSVDDEPTAYCVPGD